MIARENLPNDTIELKGLVCQLLDVVEQQKLLIANQNERIETLFLKNEAQSQRIDQLTDQVNALKRHQFGKRSEKNQKEKEEEKEKQSEKTTSQDGYTLNGAHGIVHEDDVGAVHPESREKPMAETSCGDKPSSC